MEKEELKKLAKDYVKTISPSDNENSILNAMLEKCYMAGFLKSLDKINELENKIEVLEGKSNEIKSA